MANRHLSRSIVLQTLFEWDFTSEDIAATTWRLVPSSCGKPYGLSTSIAASTFLGLPMPGRCGETIARTPTRRSWPRCPEAWARPCPARRSSNWRSGWRSGAGRQQGKSPTRGRPWVCRRWCVMTTPFCGGRSSASCVSAVTRSISPITGSRG